MTALQAAADREAREAYRLDDPLVIVSPHLDDAVLSCGCLIAAHPGTVVVTVFSGEPLRGVGLTAWDRDAGFVASHEAIGVRRAEDARALALLGATPWWLQFVDEQYSQPRPSVGAIAAALADVLAAVRPGTVLGPLGLLHPDHQASAAAVLVLRLEQRGVPCLVYEEALYSGAPMKERDRAFGALAAGGLEMASVAPVLDPTPERKRAAIACYRSQVRALLRRRVPALAVAAAPERYWRIQCAALRGAIDDLNQQPVPTQPAGDHRRDDRR